ncbi:MAG TPA: 3-carboxy-cis,cis-muconate cycloisomerase, partial [Devosia sp.]|nr:3-carboxy-cis,cis-muconate cycloisomerase [Devosia sp.]
MSVLPFGHGLLSGLLGDDEIAAFFSAESEIREMLRFETALARAEAQEGVIPAEAGEAIAARLASFAPDREAIRQATARDGVVGVEFVRQLREALGTPLGQHVHFGATSQDLVDTALMLRLRPILAILEARIGQVRGRIRELDRRFGQRRIMGRTRLQDAMPITVHDRLSAWDGPLERCLGRLREMQPRLLVLQFGGAVGTLDRLGDRGPAVAARLAAALDLGCPPRSWHSQRDNIVELGDWLSLVGGGLGKIGADIGLMAQNAIGEVGVEGSGGSSAMPHKQNPVRAEVLVSLAHFTATLVSGLHLALVHEQERSGTAWTLEWLLLPQMIVATGTSLRTAIS